ncbi:hypothetical protein DTL42_18800 [Bremerella cremea]|uniref:Uncharacterized protein n=2 Tax=Bremerella cremea TaxID=1031537 RepID=A0A368KMM6_9BACT|nr:hypothetical protein DTL42_18800 [Bremerella cremea]
MTNRDYNPAGIPRPIEKQPPALPFSQLEPYVSLPELKPETATYEGAIEFGTIAAEVAAEMELSIESAAVNLAGRRFHLVSRPASESDHRAWDVQLAAATEQEPATSKSVGHVWADSAGALKFHWNAEAEQEEAEQLQNTLLLCSHKEHRHAMALRVPDILPEIGMDLSGENGKDLTTIVSLLTPPQADTLRLTIDYPDELAVPVEAEPANRTAPLGEGMMLKLGVEKDVVRGEIRILARQKTDNQIQLSVSPKYRQEGDGKLADLTQEKLVSQISRLQRLLSKDTEELAAAYVNLPTYLANMKKLQGTVPRNKDEAGAKARTLIQLEGYVKKCQSAIRAKTRTMPASYEALHRIIEAAKLGRKLNNKAPLQYCLFAETPSGPIVLVQGNQPVEAEQKEDAFAFLDNTPGPTGTWLKLNPELQIVQFSSGGSISATDASGKRSLASGSWRAEGELIHISYGGTSDDFNFYNGVAIATEDGNAFFRKF